MSNQELQLISIGNLHMYIRLANFGSNILKTCQNISIPNISYIHIYNRKYMNKK